MAYPLLTERLEIEPLGHAGVAEFVAYRQDPAVARWQSWEADYGEAQARELVRGQPSGPLPGRGEWLQLGVHDRGSGQLLGDVAVHALADQPDTYEIGVTFARTAQGQGRATEAVRRVLQLLFDAGAHRVIATCDARNVPVARLLQRVGMRQESSQVEADWFKGEWTTLDAYAVLARER